MVAPVLSHTDPIPPIPTRASGLLPLIHQWLFDPTFEPGYHRQVENGVGWLIIVSVVAIIAEHIEPIYVGREWLFHLFDVFSVGVFTLEYVLRWATAPWEAEYAGRRHPRWRHALSFYALVDLLAIAPFYFSGLVAMDVEMLRALRLLRLMRILKLSRNMVPAWPEFVQLNRGRGLRAKL